MDFFLGVQLHFTINHRKIIDEIDKTQKLFLRV